MNKLNYIMLAFGLMVIYQIWMPLKTVYHYETTLSQGTSCKFKTAPVDPNDPFRRKYVDLRFTDLSEQLPKVELQQLASSLVPGQTVYLSVGLDSLGFAQITKVNTAPPTGDNPYFAATVQYVNNWDTLSPNINVRYPFERFYMGERKAPIEEDKYRKAQRDSTQDVHALVRIQAGVAVLEDVLINGVSLTK